jgi:hypothetical protein
MTGRSPAVAGPSARARLTRRSETCARADQEFYGAVGPRGSGRDRCASYCYPEQCLAKPRTQITSFSGSMKTYGALLYRYMPRRCTTS